MNKLVPYTWLLSGTLEVWRLRLVAFNEFHVFILPEGKLQRLKGATGKEPAAKDILIGLDKLRDCQMHSIIDDTSTPYVSNADFEGDSPQQSAFQVIQRKLVPEKQAVSLEETKPLVDNDVLAHIYDTLTNATITEVDQ